MKMKDCHQSQNVIKCSTFCSLPFFAAIETILKNMVNKVVIYCDGHAAGDIVSDATKGAIMMIQALSFVRRISTASHVTEKGELSMSGARAHFVQSGGRSCTLVQFVKSGGRRYLSVLQSGGRRYTSLAHFVQFGGRCNTLVVVHTSLVQFVKSGGRR